MKKVEENVPYFAEREEQAVIDYINSDSKEEKDRIYRVLHEPFRKMTETILRRYPIYIGNYTMEEIETSAIAHLIDHMVKYNPDKITKSGSKTKAYSYCQTIVRNFYKDFGKKSYNETKTNLSYDDFADEINDKPENSYEIEEDTHSHLDILISTIIDKINEKIDNDPAMKRNEAIVGDSIINILANWEVLFQEESEFGKYSKKVSNKFAKNKILFFIKEQTGLSTKEIRLAIKPFKEMYFIEKMGYFDE